MSVTRIALQPFENLSDDPLQDVLARGLGFDLATELARFATLEVIPSTSAARVLSKSDNDGGTSPLFVLNGGVRRLQDRIRISVQLTQGPRQVWADRFDSHADEILAVQDEIVARVAAALALRSDQARLALARRKPLVSLEAYECWLRGRESLRKGTVEGDAEARAFFERALELDPHLARAYSGLSLSHFNDWSCQAWVQWDEKERLAYEFAKRAADLDNGDAMVEIVLGRITLYRRLFDEAAEHVARALVLNPNDADVLAHCALCRAFLGDGASGVELATKAMRLNPVSGDWYIGPMTLSLFVMGRYEESIGFGARMPRRHGRQSGVSGGRTRTRRRSRPRDDVSPALPCRLRRKNHLRSHPGPWRTTEVAAARESLPAPGRHRALHDGTAPGRFDVSTRTAISSPKPSSRQSARLFHERQFRLQDDRWHLVFDGASVVISDAKGLRDLASLLASPGEERHCLEIAGRPAETGGEDAVLDDRARREYRIRLADLQREIDEAERDSDPARGSRAREEMDALVEALAGALGLGGRSRSLGSAAERARSAVTWRIRSAVRKIATVHPSLGRHLENSVRTGTYCSYQPERPIDWDM